MWKKLMIGGLVTIVVLYILFEIGYFATSSPHFCAKCHEVSKYVTSWESSVHSNVTCLECHQPQGELGKFHAKARGLNYVFQHFSGDYTIPTRAIVSDQECLTCHLGDNKSFPEAIRLKNTKAINHYKTIKESQSCLECHRDTGHDIDIYLTTDLESAKPSS
ncbi:nitrate/TMAO reductase, membrane-bound tetraheme cytochrome c subunit [Desulfosporosinus orientis DSM 765]|uniref:Cytochrome c-type protein n=1 Tax=Desulfosporosinus orientis (strain ATCC 19365 / DSM 765 / NCIMB 8382 / VKM B-1628 / Singapore I) TaxID=768706 RepID=G7WF53_DESOD|nr:NapC/NirT family cytochrome c [Desulfosporosinus orientis]AET67664.1 nitrate/TMAO reductase, membrane-bound tetraheme cytochrome c subunit [Desulfosporosinus orientis DSM 765]